MRTCCYACLNGLPSKSSSESGSRFRDMRKIGWLCFYLLFLIYAARDRSGFLFLDFAI